MTIKYLFINILFTFKNITYSNPKRIRNQQSPVRLCEKLLVAFSHRREIQAVKSENYIEHFSLNRS